MWNVLRHQVRNYVDAKRRQKEASSEGPVLHMKRTPAELMINPGGLVKGRIVASRVVLNDFTPAGVHLFTTDQIEVGALVALTLEDPKRFYVRGKVVSCNALILDQRVISRQVFPYRVAVQFHFQSEDEAAQVRSFYEEIRGLHMIDEPHAVGSGRAGEKAA